MRFIFPVNDAVEGETVTAYVVTTNSTCARTNKKHLKDFLTKIEVPAREHKRVLKAMGFWGTGLGV